MFRGVSEIACQREPHESTAQDSARRLCPRPRTLRGRRVRQEKRRWRRRWRRGWRDQHRVDLVPRLCRPAVVLHRRGLGSPLERLHTAADLQARQGQGRHPGCACPGRGHARHLAGRQDLQAQAAAEHEVLRRNPDQGIRFHVRHSAAVQGGLRRLGVLRRHRRRHRLRRGQGRDNQRHQDRRQHGRHHHHADRAERHLRERARADVRRAGSAEHPAGQGLDEQAHRRPAVRS